MKKSLTLLLLVAFTLSTYAQDFCGTVMPASYEQFLMKKDRTHLHSSSRILHNVPIQYHIVGDDDGNGYFTLNELVSLHCNLNADFAGADIQFYMFDDVQYINNDEWYVFAGFNSGDQMMNANNVNDVCNVYITEDPAGVCGYAYFPGSGPNGGGIVLNKGCSSYFSTTLSHEMGHYLGLPHTFANIGGVEFVDGSNCASRGDLFCDTPADFLDYRWDCPYIGGQTDPNGDLYSTVIDETLFMSYSMDNCQNRFSAMQEADMNNTVPNGRPYLLNHVVPNYVFLDTPDLKTPIANVSTVPAQKTILEWDPVPGAEFYHVLVSHFSNPLQFDFDLFVTDNFVLLEELLPSTQYRWRVKPLSKANFCSEYSKEELFTTSAIMVDALLSDPNCFGNANGEIEILPTSGKAPFYYQWSNGWFANPAFSLEEGVYDVTITDSDGESIVLSYSLDEPDELNVLLNISNGNVTANVQGGTPPYTYQWSDGSNANTLTDAGAGNYVVNITDANGCSASKGFVISGIGDISEDIAILSIAPNPVTSTNFNIDMNIAEPGNYVLEVLNIEGKIVHALEDFYSKDTHRLTIPTGDLANGLYFVSLTNGAEVSIERFTIIR